MADRYAVMDGTTWTGAVIARPASYGNTSIGANATEDTFRSLGLWPIIIDDPGGGTWEVPSGQTTTVDTQTETVTQTVQYGLMEVDRRKALMVDQAEREYQASLRRGFSYDGGTFAVDQTKRQRVGELVNQINATDNGRVSNTLPRDRSNNVKSTVQFVDESGTAHDFGPTQIVEFAAAGSDLVEAATDRLQELESAIQASASHADLDAIDPAAGWPN